MDFPLKEALGIWTLPLSQLHKLELFEARAPHLHREMASSGVVGIKIDHVLAFSSCVPERRASRSHSPSQPVKLNHSRLLICLRTTDGD